MQPAPARSFRQRLAEIVREKEFRLIWDSVLLGLAGALGAQLFTLLLGACQHLFLVLIAGYKLSILSGHGGTPQPPDSAWLWRLPVATTLGGLLSGFLVYHFAPEAEGHGTDAAVGAFHRAGGYIRARVPAIKMLASAITIGSGGSAGREGPIALISAGFGSLYATLLHRSDEERRVLLLAGMAAGLSAIFRSPMGTGVFAIEVLYGGMEFETNALLYTIVATGVAYAVNGAFVGWQPLFHVPPNLAIRPADFPRYIVFGVAAGLIGTLVPVVFYRVRDWFRHLPVPLWIKPGLGGLAVGVLAIKLPQVLGGGYGWMQLAIDGQLALKLAAVLMFAKLVAFAFTVSSGGSGGVFAPTLFVGAMLGELMSGVLHQPPAVFVIVGMAAVFAAAARVPVATMLMVTEMSGGYRLLVPTGLAVMVAYLLQMRLARNLKYRSLYESQVLRRADSPALYAEHVRTALSVLGQQSVALPPQLRHLDLLALLQSKVRFDLPGNRQMISGLVRPGSALAEKSLRDSCRILSPREFEFVAIFRDGSVLLPHADTRLQVGDRVLLIASQGSREFLGKQLAIQD